jgi:hypothetical protein
MTKDERLKIYTALAAPFPEEAVERTDGRVTGRGYSTTGIKYQYVVNRLNEVLGVGGYRVHRAVTVREVSTAKGRPAFDALCEIRLELGAWSDGAFITFAEAVGDGGHTSMSEADARKGAFTNAFKKCAAFFGVGRQAYEGTLDDDNVPAEESAHHTAAVPDAPSPAAAPPRAARPAATGAPAAPPGSPQPGPDPTSRIRLTQRQLALLWTLAQEQRLDQRGFRAVVKGRFGVQPEYLTRAQASELISSMGAAANTNGTGGHHPQGQPRTPVSP